MSIRKRDLADFQQKSSNQTRTDQNEQRNRRLPKLKHDHSPSTGNDFIAPQTAFYIIVLINLCAYGTGLNGHLVFDDTSAIVRNPDIRPDQSNWFSLFTNDFWGTPMDSDLSHKSYRPLTVLSFRLNYIVHEFAPFGYHLLNLIIHISVCLLFRPVAAYCLNQETNHIIPFCATILFAVHPVHVEAVTGIVGRAELLSAIFFFASILFFKQNKLIHCSLCAFLALLSKEQGITSVLVCLIIWACQPEVRQVFQMKKSPKSLPLRTWWTPVWLIILFATLVLFRFWIMGGWDGRPVFSRFDNPASVAPTPQRQLHYNYLLFLNSMLLILPFQLCCDWTMNSIPLIQGYWDVRNLFTISFYLIFIALTFQALRNYLFDTCAVQTKNHVHIKNPTLLLALVLVCIPFLPASNLIQPVGFVLAERILYLPSAGFCILITFGMKHLCEQHPNRKSVLMILFYVIVITFTLKCMIRSNDWNDELKLFQSGIQVNPNNAKLHNNIGHHYEKSRQWTEALKYFRKAQQLQPDDLGCSINVARTLINLGRNEQAERILWKLRPLIKQHAINNQKRVDPGHLKLWMHLGNLLAQNASRLDEAEQIYNELIGMRYDFVDAHINLGDVLIKKNQLTNAAQVYEHALKFNKRQADLYHNLGVVHAMMLERMEDNKGEPDVVALTDKRIKVCQYFANAIQHDSQHKEAMLNLAILMQKHVNLMSDMRGWLKERMREYKGPEVERIWFNLGLLYIDDGDKSNGEYWLRRSANQAPHFSSARLNLALLLIDQKRSVEAEGELITLLDHHPTHSRGWAILGDLYVQFGQLEKAEHNYKQVLKLQKPVPIEIMNNLCIVYRMQKQTDKAKQCFDQLKQIKNKNN